MSTRSVWSRVRVALAFATILSIVIPVSNASAQLPLTIESILTQRGKLRFELGATYTTSDQSRIDSAFQLITTGTGETVAVPAIVGSQRTKSNILVTPFAVRYGLTDNLEIYTRGAGVFENIRTEEITGTTTSTTNRRLNDVFAGLNYRLVDEGPTPALLLFADVAAENTTRSGHSFVYGRTGNVGFTTYRTYDPVALMLTAGYRWWLGRNFEGQYVQPGNFAFLNPSLNFAINSEVTLILGTHLRFREPDRINGITQGSWSTEAQLEMGVGFLWSKDLTIRMDVRTEVVGPRAVTFGLVAAYTFDTLRR